MTSPIDLGQHALGLPVSLGPLSEVLNPLGRPGSGRSEFSFLDRAPGYTILDHHSLASREAQPTGRIAMKRIALEPASVLHPHPVLIIGSYDADGKPNIMNAAWGGVCCSDPPCVSVSLRAATLTYHNIMRAEAFTVGIPSERHVTEADYVGLVSGRDHDKFRETGLTPVKSEKVNAPLVAEFPFSLECRLLEHHKLGLHTLFIGEVVGIQADEDVLSPRGLPDIEKTKAMLWGGFGNNHYFSVGAKLAPAFSVGRKIRSANAGKTSATNQEKV